MTQRHVGSWVFRIAAVSAALAMIAGCSSSSKTATPGATTPGTTTPGTTTPEATLPGVSPPGVPTRTQPPPPASGFVDASFHAKVAATCTTLATALAAEGSFPYPNFDPEHPVVTDFPGIASYEAKTVAAFRVWQTALHALGHPTAGAAAWTAYLSAIDKDVSSTVEQQRAAKQDDSATFTKTYHDLSSSGPADTRAAQAIGVPSCDPSNPK
jgi:hypothetical protein